jgi:hypothetical protein
MSTDSAAGPDWFKLWDSGYDESTGQWCTEKLIENNGLLSIELPANLPPGPYLFRPELLALHNANDGEPQFYVGCAQVFIEGGEVGALEIPEENRVSIPGHVALEDPGLSFNIWALEPAFPYPLPGPSAYTPPAETPAVANSDANVVHQTEGLVPSDILIKNANWVGFEVSSYSTQDGCWLSAEECWDQAEACYDSAPPTGNANCYVWEDKCSGINAACEARDYNGPPNEGVKLQEQGPDAPEVIPEAVNVGSGEAGNAGDRGGQGSTDGAVGSTASPTPVPTTQPTPTGQPEVGAGGSVVTVTVTHYVSARAATATPAVVRSNGGDRLSKRGGRKEVRNRVRDDHGI